MIFRCFGDFFFFCFILLIVLRGVRLLFGQREGVYGKPFTLSLGFQAPSCGFKVVGAAGHPSPGVGSGCSEPPTFSPEKPLGIIIFLHVLCAGHGKNLDFPRIFHIWWLFVSLFSFFSHILAYFGDVLVFARADYFLRKKTSKVLF